MNMAESRERPLEPLLQAAAQVVLGKERALRLALACLLARGHLLVEDLPGMGKTTLAHLLARLLGLDFARIQFTSDLLPADILGSSVFDREGQSFRFHPGPIFAQLVVADEINRATPKTQSALLEAMEERQVTVEGETRPLPEPFFVVATQNPAHQVGTFPLPESQLDRFLMRIGLGYPEAEDEKALLRGQDRRELLARLPAMLAPRQVLRLQRRVRQVRVADPLIDYCHALLASSRRDPALEMGLSPRAGLGLLAAARAWALLEGRAYVIPEDVQAVAPSCLGHRLRSGLENAPGGEGDPVQGLLRRVAVP